jgi:plastocyanin domain-containing protein
MKRYIAIMLAVLSFSGLLYAGETEKKVYKAEMDEDGVQRIEMIGGDYYFEPNHIVVKINTAVELSVRKEPGVVPHNIVISAPDAGMEVREKLSTDLKVILFTPTKTGIYPFVCDRKFLFFKSHDEKGMKGVIEVIE